ncbi:hypothetical protein DFJ66_4743 [Saccharothrix variisporea]|uniref:Uncharacterized protein n=1 Tax=Saccharothrix variisporea TaxID=543527 RepID=A0A495XF62_9PSEU|nr:hypothetical protein DFJ66_4743 [Saccharothrix variisporea]
MAGSQQEKQRACGAGRWPVGAGQVAATAKVVKVITATTAQMIHIQ